MSALSKTYNVGRDHLIHRKRSPFPYEGKALTRGKVGETYNAGQRGNTSLAAIWKVVIPTRSGLRPSPCRRRGTACGG